MSFLLPVMAAIFNLQHTQTSVNIPLCFSVLSDPENLGIAVGIALLSRTRAEIYVISYLLPVNSRHLDFRHTLTSNSNLTCLSVLFTSKTWYANGIVLISCVKAELRVITLFQPPSWISDFQFYLAVFLIAPLKSLTRKHGDRHQNYVSIRSDS